MRGRFLLLQDRLHHISRFGNVRQVDLRPNFFSPVRTRALFAPAVLRKKLLYPLGLVSFDRTGMRFLFRDPYFRQHVKNRFTLDFQLSCQIVDSNLHPPFVSSVDPA
jgi:hypothetical protein